MNPQGTSFIPQRPTQGVVKKRGTRKIYILTYISFVLFFGTILATAGTFVFKTFEAAKLDEQKKLLAQEREKFNESDMESIRDLNRRIQNAEVLIGNHVSVASIFDALEQSTLQSITLVGFDYKRLNTGVPTVTVLGTTNAFNSVIFQRSVLASSEIFANASFEEVALASAEPQEGEVAVRAINFTIEAPVDPSLIKFVPEITQPSANTEENTNGALETQDEALDTAPSQTGNDTSSSLPPTL